MNARKNEASAKEKGFSGPVYHVRFLIYLSTDAEDSQIEHRFPSPFLLSEPGPESFQTPSSSRSQDLQWA